MSDVIDQALRTARVGVIQISADLGDAIDALRQWQAAEKAGDQDELHNARMARNACIERAEQTKRGWR